MDAWGWEQLRLWLDARLELPVGPLFCVIDGPTRGRPWSSADARVEFRRLAGQAGSGAASRRTSSATPTPFRSRLLLVPSGLVLGFTQDDRIQAKRNSDRDGGQVQPWVMSSGSWRSYPQDVLDPPWSTPTPASPWP
jgi:hypothetical protein